jgi:hypothetical protein
LDRGNVLKLTVMKLSNSEYTKTTEPYTLNR